MTPNLITPFGATEGEHYDMPIDPPINKTSSSGSAQWTVATTDSELSPLVSKASARTKRPRALSNHPIMRTPCDVIFDVLGFSENPFFDSGSTAATSESRNTAAADLRLSMLSNFSTAYNVLTISLALTMMEQIYPGMTATDMSQCSSALLAGMIAGQLGGGALGDLCGRHVAMTVVMFLQVIAALLSSLAVDVTLPDGGILLSRFAVIALWRGVLGLGCGGVYPLAATLIAETQGDDNTAGDPSEKAKRVALAFSFQGIGYLAVPMATWLIISFVPATSDLAWRLLLASGALPGIFLTVLRVRRLSLAKRGTTTGLDDVTSFSGDRLDCEMTNITSQTLIAKPSVVEAIRNEPNLWVKLAGTGGCWLIFDILFYGTTLFQPVVLNHAFGAEQETIGKEVRDSAMVAAMALPGYFVSVRMVGRQSPRYIQMQGFLVMGLLYACISVFFRELGNHRYLLLGLYGSTFFFSNYGPNATTFLLPSMTFSRNCRSTLNGICAACGKVGALIGALVFVEAAHQWGEPLVFACCSLLSMGGLLITWQCVAENVDDSVEPENNKTEVNTETVSQQLPAMPPNYSMPSLFDYFHSPRQPDRI